MPITLSSIRLGCTTFLGSGLENVEFSMLNIVQDRFSRIGIKKADFSCVMLCWTTFPKSGLGEQIFLRRS